VYVAELAYEKRIDDHPDYVCSVAAILDPPPGLPVVVAGSGGSAADGPAAAVEVVARWREVRMWGLGDVVWTLGRGPLSSGVIDLRLDRLLVLLAAVSRS
jgi:hypothetical protein